MAIKSYHDSYRGPTWSYSICETFNAIRSKLANVLKYVSLNHSEHEKVIRISLSSCALKMGMFGEDRNH